MDIGRTGDKGTTNAERRKRAGLHEDYEKLSPIMKFGTNNWFRLVVIGFLVIFTYQLNKIHNDMFYIDSGDRVTIDYISKDAIRQLEKVRDRN
ncbi:hypothetical protein OAB74_00240 [Candidatus Pelagibacter sp.]|nr:hypothetical protein [Candidatus Pelagibacter sp.]